MKVKKNPNYTIAKEHYSGEVYATSYEIIGGKDVMPLITWSGPFDCMATDEFYKEFKELGLNVFVSMPTYLEHKEATLKHLALAEKYNIAGFVPYSEKYFPVNREQLIEVHKACQQYKSFVGMTHRDELIYGDIWEKYVPIIRMFEQTEFSEKYEYYFNANPIWSKVLGEQFFGGHSYRTYLKSYVCDKGLRCKMLCSDMYPFVGDDDLLVHNYFKQLAVQRDVAYKYKVPFWMYVQCGTITERNLSETTGSEAAFRWNVNVALAFGAKGIAYFTLTYSRFGKNGWIDLRKKHGKDCEYADKHADGTQAAIYNEFDNLSHNRWYDYVVNINKHIQAIDEILMNSYHAGIIVYGKSPYRPVKLGKIEGTSWYELKEIKGKANLLIGCFEYKGKTTLYVVNNSYKLLDDEEQAVLVFDDTYQYQIIQRATERFEVGNELSLKLQGGEGVLITLQ